jgi:hypothetical protein
LQARPIVILGAARSGTKIVRDLIAESGICRAVPYDVNFVWRFGNERARSDIIDPEDCHPGISKFIRNKLVQMSGADRDHGCRYIVEKTVSNTLRVPFVREVLPEALFIHLIRDGRDVVESSWRMWHEPVEAKYLLKKLRYFPINNFKYACWYAWNILSGRLDGRKGVKVWGVRYPGLEEDINSKTILNICALQWKYSVEAVQDFWDQIPSGSKLEIRYENLESGEGEIRKVCQFLALPDEERVVDNFKEVFHAPGHPQWPNKFSQAEWQGAMRIMGPLLQQLGYSDSKD